MTTPADAHATTYRFADLTLDVARRAVLRQGRPVELKSLDFDLLRFLVESAPSVVNADVLAENVWGRHFVSPDNVAQRVMLLRHSLGDDAAQPRYVETIRNKGYRLIPAVERVQRDEPARSVRPWLVAGAAIVLVTTGFATAVRYWFAEPEQRTPLPSSVAVLPFENLSPASGDAFFAAGMQPEIVNQLVKIGGLRVFPVHSIPDAPGSIAEVLRELNVATVLGGSVHYAEGRVRVNLHLTEAATSEVLWAASDERALSDIFGIQADFALRVARELRLELSAAERDRVQRVPTTDPRARDLYLMARARKLLSPEVRIAIEELEQALAIDPAFKDAWVVAAQARNLAQFVEPDRADEHRRRAVEAAKRALELDPQLGNGHATLGWALQTLGDWAGAEAAFRNAEFLNVPSAELGAYAFLRLSTGRFEPEVGYIYEEARAADPQLELYHRFLAFFYDAVGDSARAAAAYEAGLQTFARDARATFNIANQRMHWLIGRNELEKARAMGGPDALNAAVLAAVDDPEQALALLRREYASSGGGNPVARRDIGLWAGHLGDTALAFDALRAAIEEQPGQIVYLWLPQLSELRRRPEFAAYMREIGLASYWRHHGWPSSCRPLDEEDFQCH